MASHEIQLNFLQISGTIPDFIIYRQRRKSPQDSRPDKSIQLYKLPENIESFEDSDPWHYYWVSYENLENFTEYKISANVNHDVTCGAMFWALSKVTQTLNTDEFSILNKGFIKQVEFVLEKHDEGNAVLILQPYFLKINRQFGFIADFHFRLSDGVTFSRRVQQLSLSLDRDFKRNLDYYTDKWSRIHTFLRRRQDVLKSICLPGTNTALNIAEEFINLPAHRLASKIYTFKGRQTSDHQFAGLRDYGPLRQLENDVSLFFIFREQDRQFARTLANDLRNRQPNFPGFTALFRRKLKIDPGPFVIHNLEEKSIRKALETTNKKKQQQSDSILVPVLILPSDDDSYFTQKAFFSSAQIASQVCTLRTLKDDNSLKWAIANIALQIFCKAGGYPWKVVPSMDTSLIIGISQSHKFKEINGKREIEKYFAFSVMTDNSGLFQSLQVLGEGENESDYITTLQNNLREMLKQKSCDFSRIVVHTHFKLRQSDIKAIQRIVKEVSQDKTSRCQFAVVKVNEKSRFFGVNKRVNSLVPYEATCVNLGGKQYLLWFEGIDPTRTTVKKAFPGPTHLEVLYNDDIEHNILLQDLVNLSGANWRGFNAKSSPVSVYYCRLIADFIGEFHKRDLPIPEVENVRPWFL